MGTRTKDLKAFHNKNFLIKKVYAPYRDGWLDNGTTKIHRTFKYFPFHEVDILKGRSPEMEEVSAAFKLLSDEGKKKQELREQIWENGFPSFHKIKEKMDSEFFKTWKKVFDIEIEVEKPFEIEVWDSVVKGLITTEDTEFNVTTIGAGKIKSMLRSLMDEDNGEVVPMVQGKDKAGNEAMVEAYDWEDTLRSVLEGKYMKMKVSGEGMDTKYIFQEGKQFAKVMKQESDNPFDDPAMPF